MTITTINPATAEVLATYQEMPQAEAYGIIEKTQSAYLQWRRKSFAERAVLMNKLAALLRENKQRYAELIAKEMGKPLLAGMAEIEKCAWVCEHYAEHAEQYLAVRNIATQMQKSYVTYQPLGLVFAIMPWNFPFWQVFRFAAPCLMAGNGALLKHAPISTGTALAIEDLFQQAGFPHDIFRSLIVDNDVAAKVIEHPDVIAVTLTGSERAGRVVGAHAATALKKIVLELGGSDPYIILEDADLALAAEQCVKSRMNNTGQVCIAAKRIIAIDSVADELLERIKTQLATLVSGDPLQQGVTFGPMARRDLRDEVHAQVQASIAKGAKLLLGGKIPDQAGFYYPPTLLTHVTKGMPAYDEEIFGPVICLLTAKDEAEAITMANDSQYGLGAAVFTQDIARGEAIAAEQIQAGSCFVNTLVLSDPRLPFGGIKQSGYGRELSSEGIREFVNAKTVAVA